MSECLRDGGQCGVGGYCNDCPYPGIADIERMKAERDNYIVVLRLVAAGKESEYHEEDAACIHRLSKLAYEALAKVQK